MGRRAERVYTNEGDIAVLERWVRELPMNASVRITKHDGEVIEGKVSITPNVQVFLDPHDVEGMNGMVRLVDINKPDWDGLVWLGDIRDVEHLDSVKQGASRA